MLKKQVMTHNNQNMLNLYIFRLMICSYSQVRNKLLQTNFYEKWSKKV